MRRSFVLGTTATVMIAALAGTLSLLVMSGLAQGNGVAVEVTVWRAVSDPTLLYVSTRPEGGRWHTLDTPLDMSGRSRSGKFHQSNAVLIEVLPEGRSTVGVEVTVWRSVSDPMLLHVSTRPEGGRWDTLDTPLDMSARSRSGKFHQSNAVRVQVPLPASTGAPGGAAMAACANGVVVSDSDNNPGLVHDCAVLLEAQGTLDGDGEAFNWSADIPIEDWSDVGLWGSPLRVVWVASGGRDLRGQIPPVLARLDQLASLSLTDGNLTGEIPPELGQLSQLRWLRLGENRLTGTIPPQLGQLSQLQELDLGDNELTGEIPPELGRLTQLEILDLTYFAGRNEFTGAFPTALRNLSKLTELRLDTRNMTGCVPPSLREFASRWRLPFCLDGSSTSTLPPPDPQLVMACSQNGAVPDAGENPGLADDCAVLLEAKATLANDDARLNWSADIPLDSWDGISVEGSPRRVAELWLPSNDLGGRIPAGLARLSHLRELWLARNGLTGELPAELGQLWNLRELWLLENELTGEIPPELAQLAFLESVRLGGNRLGGRIPAEIGSITSLTELNLRDNLLTGEIPPELAGLPNLEYLQLRGNRLTGNIPRQLFSMWSLRELDLRDNRLTGAILPEFASSLGLLWLSGNQLTGCLSVTTPLGIADYSELGLPYCQCLGQWSEGASPELTVGADGIPFMPHESTEVAGTYRVSFSLVLDLPDGGTFSLGTKERSAAGQVLVSIAEERSRSTLVIDPFMGEERARAVVEVPPDCDVSIATLFDDIVNSARVQPVEPRPGPDGIQSMYRLQPVEGGKRYRIGGSRFTTDVPAGIRLTLEGYQGICVTPGGCHTLLELRDEGSGSRLSFDADTGEEFHRWVSEEGASRNVDALFDQIAASLREDPPPTCLLPTAAPDCAVLLEVKETLAGSGELNWSSDVPLTNWEGVGVSRWTGQVVELDLHGDGATSRIPPALAQLPALEVLSLSRMTGPIPPALGQLSSLRSLDLRRNDLTGSIPRELGQLSNLRVLDLSFNQLSGELPPELGSLANLRVLDVSFNRELGGGIPPELGLLSNLRVLDLSLTNLGGEFPVALLALSNLQDLELGGLAGGLPPELAALSSLQRLHLGGSFTGGIPPELGQLRNLRTLSLGSLTGEIPPELGSLWKLEELSLSGDLTGKIPPELGQLSYLRTLSLANSQLTGEIPAELGQLWSLESLQLGYNQLTGGIPPELGQLGRLEFIYLGGNRLTGEIPARWGALPYLLNIDLSWNQLEGCIPPGLENFVGSTSDSNPDLRNCSGDQ